MKKKSSLLIITALGLGISSCSYFESFNEKRKEVEENSKPTIQIKAKAEGKEQEVEENPLAKAIEDAEGTTREQETVGLLKSTNPEIRVSQSVRGRTDPFSTIVIKPKIEVEPVEEEEETQPRETLPNRNQERNQNNNRRNQNTNNRTVQPNNIQPNNNITSTPTIEDLETPEPVSLTELAENVLITGLVDIGDRVKIILQAPQEATSRYVNVGQYISNGRILVKRIEYGFPAPTVILEQSGIEVTRIIGQPVEEENDEDEQALLPPPSNTSSWLSNYLSP